MKNLQYCFFLLISILFSACHLQMESTYYADKTSSGSLYMRFDEMLTEQMKSKSDTGEFTYDGKNLNELPRKWTNLYEYVKASEDPKLANLDQDTIQFLQLIEIKFDIEDDQFKGMGYRIQRTDTTMLKKFNQMYSSSNPTNGLQSDTSNSFVPEGLDARWDGEKLIIPIMTFDDKKKTDKKAKKGDDDDMDMMTSIMKMANFSYTYTYRFEKKIKKIEGKNSLVKKIDDYTVEYKFDLKEMLEQENKKSSKNNDKEVVVYTKL